MGKKQLLKSKASQEIFAGILSVVLTVFGLWLMGSHLYFHVSSSVVEAEIVSQSVNRSRGGGRHSTKRTRTYKIIAGEYAGIEHTNHVFMNFDAIGHKIEARFNPQTGVINTFSNTMTHAFLGFLLTLFGAFMLTKWVSRFM